MATYTVTEPRFQLPNLSWLPTPKVTVSADRLWQQLKSLTPKNVKDFVRENKKKDLHLKKPAAAQLKIAAAEDTMYDPDEVNGWGKFYLPGTATMQVFGVVEGILSQHEELALMLCEENKHIYAYDEEDLHLVASGMKELCDVGIEYPGTETYYKGQAFKDMTKEDWEKVRQGKVGQKLDEEHAKLVAIMKPGFLENLK